MLLPKFRTGLTQALKSILVTFFVQVTFLSPLKKVTIVTSVKGMAILVTLSHLVLDFI